MPISLQSGIREYNGDLSQFTGMLGGLTPDIHTLRSLNPLTTNRVICVMHRGPYFLMHYFAGINKNAYASNSPFATYKKLIEYYNMGITPSIGEQSLGTATLKGGFAGRTMAIPTTQNANSNQQLTIQIPELCGRPAATFHNMWVDGISDQITGLTTYHGLVAGSVSNNGTPQRIFAPATGASEMALEPSPAWEVGEFLLIALDRSGARVEGAIMALGCTPAGKVGLDSLFTHNNEGTSDIQKLELRYNCQFIQSNYINDLAARYVRQFAVFGNSMNYNPGAGDAFFNSVDSSQIDTAIFNNGKRPTLDGVQSGLGNAPVIAASRNVVQREAVEERETSIADHSRIYNGNDAYTDIRNPYH